MGATPHSTSGRPKRFPGNVRRMIDWFSRVEETAEALEALVRQPDRSHRPPTIGLVLGSGLGAFGDSLKRAHVNYRDLPHMPHSTVPGHAGRFAFGTVEGINVVCMQGRIHLYEGHSANAVVHGVRVMAHMGVRCVLLTNAAGGCVPEWSAGDLMLITDHLNLTGISPLTGPNEDQAGPRFPDMSQAYDADLSNAAREIAKGSGIALREGVYAGLQGPSYETPAEVRMLRNLGADAVGMSTVLEVIALRHLRIRV